MTPAEMTAMPLILFDSLVFTSNGAQFSHHFLLKFYSNAFKNNKITEIESLRMFKYLIMVYFRNLIFLSSLVLSVETVNDIHCSIRQEFTRFENKTDFI